MKFTRCGGAIAILLLVACGPSEQHKAQLAEQKRLECLDKFCEGDVVPKSDPAREVTIKLNGQWYLSPKQYTKGLAGLAFYWPSKTPVSGRSDGKDYSEVRQDYSDAAIEIFLRHHDGVMHGPPRYQALLSEQVKGRVISKTEPQPGLEVWVTHRKPEGRLPVTWYVATDLRDANDEPPVLGCVGIDGSERDTTEGTCTMAFMWRPYISADLRFRAKHGPDWPEIYLEVNRVLQLLRKA